MKRLGKLFAAAIALSVMVAGLPAQAAEAGKAKDIVILHTNDVHCGIDQKKDDSGKVTHIGYAGVAAYRNEMAEQVGADRVTLVDAGDAIQGGSIGTLSEGSYLVDILNEVGYQLAIPGNHEFDFGMEQFLALAQERAKYRYLSSNFVDSSGEPVFPAYAVIDYGDVQVAYVGISTPESLSKSNPTHFQNEAGDYVYGFRESSDGKLLYEAVQSAVDEAKAEGADYVVALAHLGQEGSTEAWTSNAVVQNTAGIDVLIDGHSHEQYTQEVKNKEGEDTLVVQTGTKLAALGKVTITPETGKISSELITGYEKTDPDIADYIQQVNDEFAGILQQEVGVAAATLTTLHPETGERAVRNAETNLGDFCADAYRAVTGAEVAIVNGGSVRADIAAGPVTYEEIINVHPYGNQVCLIEATGQQILDALELGASLYPEESGGFLQVSGISYTINAGKPSHVMLNDQKEFLRVDGEYRVADVLINGEPLELDRVYSLASHDYMLKSGGDGFTMFKSCTLLQDGIMLDNQVLINYFSTGLDGKTGEEYADPKGQGRITVIQADVSGTGEAKLSPKPETKPGLQALYAVQPEDSLWVIAQRQLGDGYRWSEIYELNREDIANPDIIYTGQELKLPA